MSNSQPRAEGILATVTVVLAIVSFVCLVAVLIAAVAGVNFSTDVPVLWDVAVAVAWWGLPLSLVGLAGVIVVRILANRKAP